MEVSSIVFRPLKVEDVTDEYFRWISDPEIIKYLEVRHTNYNDINELKDYVVHVTSDKNKWLFGIFYGSNQYHIGNVKLQVINEVYKNYEIGIILGNKKYHGRNIGVSAIEFVAQFAKAELDCRKLIAGCYSENLPSIKLFKKCGFSTEAVLTDEVIVDDQAQDVLLMSRFL